MRYWTIETSPGWLLVDDAAVTQDVARLVGRPTVEAPCLLISRLSVDAFMENFPRRIFSHQAGAGKSFWGRVGRRTRALGGTVLGVSEFYTPGDGPGRQKHVRRGKLLSGQPVHFEATGVGCWTVRGVLVWFGRLAYD